MNNLEWNKLSSNLLKSEIKRRGLSYEELQKKLAQIGVEETTNGITIKINRGTFSFSFFLQVMRALEAKTLHLEN